MTVQGVVTGNTLTITDEALREYEGQSLYITVIPQSIAESRRKPLDFSKYDTATHLWNEDAQFFVDRMRADDRF